MTIFHHLDAIGVALALTVFFASRQWAVGWAVGSLLLFHLGGRYYLVNGTLLDLAAMQTAMASGFLFGPFLTVYGRLVGTIYAVMSMASLAVYASGNVPPVGHGLGLNIWNFHSLCLHVIVGLTIIGTVRHGRIATRNRPVRH